MPYIVFFLAGRQHDPVDADAGRLDSGGRARDGHEDAGRADDAHDARPVPVCRRGRQKSVREGIIDFPDYRF